MTLAHAGGVGAARAHDHVLAGARVDVAGALRPGAGRPRRGRERDRRVRAGADGRRPALRRRGAAAVRRRRRGRRDPARRLVGARLRPDLRQRRRRRARRHRSSASTAGAGSSSPTTTTRGSRRACSSASARTRRDATHFILEGGSITVDGEGTLITTEQCLFEEHRNPRARARGDRGGAARPARRGAVVWLGLGLVEDDDTDGHVDNICAFVEPGKVVLQTVTDEANPNYEHVPGEPAPAAGRRAWRSSSCRGCPTSPGEEPAGRRAVHELLRLQRRPDRARRAARRPTPRRSR